MFCLDIFTRTTLCGSSSLDDIRRLSLYWPLFLLSIPKKLCENHSTRFLFPPNVLVALFNRQTYQSSFKMRLSSTYLFCLVAAFISHSTGHFLLNYPPTIGFDDTLEGTPPCGSFSVDFSTDNVTNFHVAGDSIAVVRALKI